MYKDPTLTKQSLIPHSKRPIDFQQPKIAKKIMDHYQHLQSLFRPLNKFPKGPKYYASLAGPEIVTSNSNSQPKEQHMFKKQSKDRFGDSTLLPLRIMQDSPRTNLKITSKKIDNVSISLDFGNTPSLL